MALFYRGLAGLCRDAPETVSDAELMAPLMEAYYRPEQLTQAHRARTGAWLRRYLMRLREDDTPDLLRRQRMDAVNPKYVLRNYLAQVAIDQAEQGDNSGVNDLLEVLRRPYDEQPGNEGYAAKRPEWARHRPGCSMLSCSS